MYLTSAENSINPSPPLNDVFNIKRICYVHSTHTFLSLLPYINGCVSVTNFPLTFYENVILQL